MPGDSKEIGKLKIPVEEAKEATHHCEICNKYYASYKSYGNHVRSYHSKNREKSKCPHCGNCFTRRDNLQQHIKLFHGTKDENFKCRYCANNFHTKNACTKHQKSCLNKPREQHASNQNQWDPMNKTLNSAVPAEVKTNQSLKRKIESPSQQPHPQSCTCCFCVESKKKLKTHSSVSEPYSSNHFYTGRHDLQVDKDRYAVYRSNFSEQGHRENIPICEKHRRHAQIHHSEINTTKEGDKFPELLQKQNKPLLTGLDGQSHNIDFIKPSNDISKNSHFNVQHFDSTIYNSTILDSEEDVDRALDCHSCNITFLTKHDYQNHKPFCHEMAKS